MTQRRFTFDPKKYSTNLARVRRTLFGPLHEIKKHPDGKISFLPTSEECIVLTFIDLGHQKRLREENQTPYQDLRGDEALVTPGPYTDVKKEKIGMFYAGFFLVIIILIVLLWGWLF
jgi:hypothetical protein